jgi:hypothetical protein
MPTAFKALLASLPAASDLLWQKTKRRLVKLQLGLAGADEATHIRAQRRLRGKDQNRRLQKADAKFTACPRIR